MRNNKLKLKNQSRIYGIRVTIKQKTKNNKNKNSNKIILHIIHTNKHNPTNNNNSFHNLQHKRYHHHGQHHLSLVLIKNKRNLIQVFQGQQDVLII